MSRALSAGDEETIVALSSAPGPSQRAVVRLSGKEASRLAERFFGADEAEPKVSAGRLRLPGADLDLPAIRYRFPAGHSYTGEELIEFHFVGAPPVVEALLEELELAGARPAGPGEFTRRAFLAGRIDLAQAEAVCALVGARGEAERRRAMQTLAGGPSREVAELIEGCKEVAAFWTAALDFAEEEEIEIDAVQAGRDRLVSVRARLEVLVGNPREEAAPSGEVTVALCGPAGVGKSTLFNRLVGEERALVSGHPGTTRDLLEASLEIEGVRFRLLDLAGMREGTVGVERTALDHLDQTVRSASLRLVVLDASCPPDGETHAFLERLPEPIVWVVNKIDLAPAGNVLATLGRRPEVFVSTAALSGEGLDELRAALFGAAGGGAADASSAVLGARQRAAGRRALAAVNRAEETLGSGFGAEIATLDLDAAMGALGEIVGQVETDDILDLVFGRFCIGK